MKKILLFISVRADCFHQQSVCRGSDVYVYLKNVGGKM